MAVLHLVFGGGGGHKFDEWSPLRRVIFVIQLTFVFYTHRQIVLPLTELKYVNFNGRVPMLNELVPMVNVFT